MPANREIALAADLLQVHIRNNRIPVGAAVEISSKLTDQNGVSMEAMAIAMDQFTQIGLLRKTDVSVYICNRPLKTKKLPVINRQWFSTEDQVLFRSKIEATCVTSVIQRNLLPFVIAKTEEFYIQSRQFDNLDAFCLAETEMQEAVWSACTSSIDRIIGLTFLGWQKSDAWMLVRNRFFPTSELYYSQRDYYYMICALKSGQAPKALRISKARSNRWLKWLSDSWLPSTPAEAVPPGTTLH